MTIYYNATGTKRKELAAAVGEFFGVKPKYRYMPTCAYAIDLYTVNREGNLEFSDRTDSEEVETLIDFLYEHGFRAIPVKTDEAEIDVAATEATIDAESHDTVKPIDVISATDKAASSTAEKPLKGSEDFGEEVSVGSEKTQPNAHENDLTATDSLTISLPLDCFTETSLENLKRLVNSKATIIKHAIGTNDLPIEVSENTVTFPGFHLQRSRTR